MQYICLIYVDEKSQANMTEQELTQQYTEYNAYTAEMKERGLYVTGEALHPTNTATTVRVRDGKTLTTDGPFMETHETLGGYYILNCKNLDEAIEAAAKIPDARLGSIEIRPLVDFSQGG